VSELETPPVRAVWTDFGGVLTPPVAQTLMGFCQRAGVPAEAFLGAWWKVTVGFGTDDIMAPLDTPLVTEAEWLRQVAAILRDEHGITLHLSTMADAWFDNREANTGWVDRLRRLRGDGVFVGLLSNMVPTWDGHWRRMVPPDGLFDDIVLSFQVGHRKPSPEIFALAARRAGVAPAECLLVDDMAKNCAGAEAAGWQAIHFTDTDTAIAELDRRPVRTGVRT
jgi:putative hydrolase of the HAD superfamily